jgi:large subunit ribosomal protein L3
MGHRKYSAPRRGSLAYLPRGRSSHWAPRIRFWPEYEGAPKLLAFAGFKAGTSHVTIVDNRQGSLNYGKEVTLPVTVVETPPLLVTGLRFYERFNGGLRTSGEVWAPEPSKDLGRRIKVPEKFDENKGWEKLESAKERVVEVQANPA